MEKRCCRGGHRKAAPTFCTGPDWVFKKGRAKSRKFTQAHHVITCFVGELNAYCRQVHLLAQPWRQSRWGQPVSEDDSESCRWCPSPGPGRMWSPRPTRCSDWRAVGVALLNWSKSWRISAARKVSSWKLIRRPCSGIAGLEATPWIGPKVQERPSSNSARNRGIVHWWLNPWRANRTASAIGFNHARRPPPPWAGKENCWNHRVKAPIQSWRRKLLLT